jgi:hypothetical protein
MAEDEFSLACQKVGLFFHKFAFLEQEINERIVDMLKLKGDAADVVSHGLDFFKKFNLLKTVAVGQTPSEEKERVEGIFSDIAKQNDSRQVMAHSRFEPGIKGSVQFRRTVAKDGKVKVQDKDHLWTVERFAGEFEKLDELRAKLNELKPRLNIKYDEDGRSEYWYQGGPQQAMYEAIYDGMPMRRSMSPALASLLSQSQNHLHEEPRTPDKPENSD